MTARTARTLVIAGVLGIITTLLVTAWCVWRVSTRNTRVYYGVWNDGAASYLVAMNARPGKVIAYWSLDIPGEPTPPLPAGVRPARWSSTGDAAHLVRMRGDPPKREMPHGHLRRSTRFDVAYGWPMLAFRGGMFVFPSLQPQTQHDFGPLLPEIWTTETNFQTMEPRTMPLRPMALGVIANTGVYGAAWWLVVFAPGVIRRERRRRRGACIACGYDRRGIGVDVACPECGDMSRER